MLVLTCVWLVWLLVSFQSLELNARPNYKFNRV